MTTKQLEDYEGLTGELQDIDIPVFLREIALQLSRLNDHNEAGWKWERERDEDLKRRDEQDDAERAGTRSEVVAMREAYEKLVSVFAASAPKISIPNTKEPA